MLFSKPIVKKPAAIPTSKPLTGMPAVKEYQRQVSIAGVLAAEKAARRATEKKHGFIAEKLREKIKPIPNPINNKVAPKPVVVKQPVKNTIGLNGPKPVAGNGNQLAYTKKMM